MEDNFYLALFFTLVAYCAYCVTLFMRSILEVFFG